MAAMFGITLPKILLLVAIFGVVWWVFRRAEARLRRRHEGESGASQRRATGRGNERSIEDMVQCRVCGAYVASAGASKCGKANCPV